MTKKEWLQKFSYLLLGKLDEQHLNGYKLAQKVGCYGQNFYPYIYGNSVPSAYIVGKMAKGLGCTTDELIMLEDYEDEYFEQPSREYIEVPKDIPSNVTLERWKKLFGQNLYNKMVERGLSQKELASRSNINAVCIRRYIDGDMIPNGWRLVNLAKALGCTVDELVDFGCMIVECR